METLTAIAKRASIRKFVKEALPQQDIDAILEAVFSAPSAMNKRPYELIINTDNSVYLDYAEEKPTCKIMANAGLTILFVGDLNKMPMQEFVIEDCSACVENALLAATDLGYGSLWGGITMGSPFQKKLIEKMGIPEGYLPIALIAIGKAGESKEQKSRFEKEKIHLGRF